MTEEPRTITCPDCKGTKDCPLCETCCCKGYLSGEALIEWEFNQIYREADRKIKTQKERDI